MLRVVVSYTGGTDDVLLTQHKYIMVVDTIAVMIDVTATLTPAITASLLASGH